MLAANMYFLTFILGSLFTVQITKELDLFNFQIRITVLQNKKSEGTWSLSALLVIMTATCGNCHS